MYYGEIFMLPWSENAHYRIPSLIVTNDGTVLAFCNNRKDSGQDHADEVDLVLIRKPLGENWEEPRAIATAPGWICGIGSAVYDPVSDTARCTFGRSAAAIREWKDYTKEELEEIERRVREKAERDGIRPGSYVAISNDSGKTWSEEPQILAPTQVEYTDGTQHSVTSGCHGSSHGILLKHGAHAGRLVCPSRFSIGDYSTMETIKYHSYNNCIYSDDRGKTWKTSQPVQIGTGEGTLIEREDGTLLYNSRAYYQDGKRRTAVSRDGGETWGEFSVDEFLIEDAYQGCNASFLRVERESFDGADKYFPEGARAITVFLNPRAAKRENMTACVSFDDGATWTHTKRIWQGGGGYSSLDFNPHDQKFHLMYECAGKIPHTCGITLAEFDLEWLMQEDM